MVGEKITEFTTAVWELVGLNFAPSKEQRLWSLLHSGHPAPVAGFQWTKVIDGQMFMWCLHGFTGSTVLHGFTGSAVSDCCSMVSKDMISAGFYLVLG